MSEVLYNGPMFNEPKLVHIKCEHWDAKKKILLKLKERGDKVSRVQEEGHIKTDYHYQVKENLFFYNKHLADILEIELQSFCNCINAKSVEVTNSWFETSERNAHHGIHNHGGDGYSAVCFVQYNSEEHTATRFLSPSLSALINEPLIRVPKVEEGDILFFPSNLPHYTEPTESDEVRSVLSWNLQVYDD